MPRDDVYSDFNSDWDFDQSDPFFDMQTQKELEGFQHSFGEKISLTLLRQVADVLGVETTSGSILFETGQFAPENMRGVRFTSVEAALIYLFDAGILNFSNVVVTKNGEIGVEADPNSNRRRKKKRSGR